MVASDELILKHTIPSLSCIPVNSVNNHNHLSFWKAYTHHFIEPLAWTRQKILAPPFVIIINIACIDIKSRRQLILKLVGG
jgi:hypothetical protein